MSQSFTSKDARTHGKEFYKRLYDIMWNPDIPYKERVKQIKDIKTWKQGRNLKEERINAEIDEQLEYEQSKNAPIRLTIEQADEVIDALRWVDDDWENMDEAERITHKGMRDVFYSILDQYPIDDNSPTYPEPEGDPSY